jgi:hypothetical protein
MPFGILQLKIAPCNSFPEALSLENNLAYFPDCTLSCLPFGHIINLPLDFIYAVRNSNRESAFPQDRKIG